MEYPYSLDDYISDLKEYIKKNDITRPSVIAHSFGARLVLKMCATDPDLFDKIVITGGAGLKPRRSVKYRLKRLAFRLSKPFLHGKKPKAFYSKDYLGLSPIMQKSFSKIVSEHLDWCLEKIENQTLIIYGEKDKETPVYMAKRLNKNIKNSKMLIVKGAGHFCFIDAPMKFNWEVREFLLSKKICFR